ncbi:MAG TPA: EAL domain-containing protein [Burkholderiales bacterium]|nr:EAL domain-containing protein [Burkholderiales bacterium]
METDELWRRLWDASTDAIIVLDPEGRIRFANEALREVFGHAPAAVIGSDIALLQPERLREAHRSGFARHLATGERRVDWRSVETRGLHASGREFPVEITFTRLEAGGETRFAAFVRDITERKRATGRLEAQKEILELIATGAPLDTTLERLTLLVEREFRDLACSILLLDESGTRIRNAAAPSLPAAFNRAIEGETIGPRAGSCGTAAWRKELVVVRDIATDPLWEPWRAIALEHNLRACWSMPVLSHAGNVLGTFAMYYGEPREPSPRELELIRVAASFAGIAIERTREDARRREAVERFELISKATNDVVWDWDIQANRVWWNEAYYERFGYPREQASLGAESWSGRVHPDDREAVLKTVHDLIEGGGTTWQGEYRFRRADGEYVHVFDRGFVVRDAFDTAVRMLGAMVDITERKRAEERLEQLAQYDTLTRLPNRALFRDRLEQAVARARREKWCTALAFIDLDRFKEINDTLGHAAGDAMLRAVAQRLRGCLREGDTVARLGGDEFTAILEDVHGATDVQVLAEKMMAALEQPVVHDGREFFATASIGFALYPDDGEDADALLAHADTAMYQAKGEGGNAFEHFVPDMAEAARGRVTLESGLRRALERGELELHYQPIFRLGDRSLSGAEALLRWRHPERGLVAPGEFIAVAEATGLIVPIGAWVLREACAQAKRWRAVRPDLRIGVNCSARQFRRAGLVETVRGALARSGLAADGVVLEITESLLMENPEGSRKVLDDVKALGLRVALDDFGTGYSSLAYLRRFPIDGLKIDRSFIRDLTTDPEDAKIVRAVIHLARDLRLAVTAEGIETPAQLDFVLAHGCDFGQGYLFGRPVPVAEFEKHLAP